MRKLFYWIPIALMIGVLSAPASGHAQTGETCTDQLATLQAALATACEGLAAGQACVQGEIVDVASLDLIETSAINSGDAAAEAALLHIPASRLDQPLVMALFGEASLTNTFTTEQPTVELTNSADFNINLREAPGTDYALAGSLLAGTTAVVDGVNAAGDWLHIRTDESSAWMFASLLEYEEGQLDGLAVLDDFITAPMQSVTLTTNAASSECGAGAVGLLIAHQGDNTAYVQVNGVNVALGAGSALLQADENGLSVHVLTGSIGINDTEAEAGALVQVATDAAPEVVQEAYPFGDVVGLPYALAGEEALACIVGTLDAPVNAYSLPDMESDAVGEVVSSARYAVTGQADDEDEAAWWRISLEGKRAWVPQDAVLSAGACEAVPEVSPTAPVVSSGGGSSSGGGGTGSALVPAGTTVWQGYPGSDNMSGTCATPPLVICEHLVAITPSGSTLAWRGQEPTPYTMYSVGGDTYSYTGRNRINTANLTLTLTFTSPTSWVMTWQQVEDVDPTCVHTFNYTASLR